MELNDEAIAQTVMPEKYRMGKTKYLRFIKKAVRIFEKGAVRSSMILGLEPTESTLAGVESLARIGCDPMLSTFKPLKGTLLSDTLSPSQEFQTYIYEKAEKIAQRHNVLLGPRCIPCQHNTLTFPVAGKNYFFY